MKRGNLFLCLVLISILFISGCSPVMSPKDGPKVTDPINGGDPVIRSGVSGDQSLLPIQEIIHSSIDDLNDKFESLEVFELELSDGTLIKTTRNYEICDCDILNDCGEDWSCTPGEQLTEYTIDLSVQSKQSYGVDPSGRVVLDPVRTSENYAHSRDILNEITHLESISEIFVQNDISGNEIRSKINHELFIPWLIGTVSDEEFKAVDWCSGCGSSGPGTCYNWCVSGSGSFNWQCFSGETEIASLNGKSTKIENLRRGDEIISFDPESNKKVSSEVKNIFVSNSKELLLLNNQLEVTPEHPFYVNEKWVEAKNLVVGDELKSLSGESIKVDSILKSGKTDSVVYNLEVNNPHTFYAENILVHNKHFVKSARIKFSFWVF